MKINLKIP